MDKTKAEKPVAACCPCGSVPVWTKVQKLGHLYTCPSCLTRGVWKKTRDEAIENWNNEVQRKKYENKN